MSKAARILGAVLWALAGLGVWWWWFAPAAFAQGKAQTLCYPPVAGSSSCQPVSPTTPYPMKPFGIANVAAPTYIEGAVSPFSFDLTGNLRVAASITPSGTQNTNVIQWGSVAVLAGNGATGTGSPRITLSNDNTVPTGWPSSANQTAAQAPVAPATATATKSDLVGCQATSAAVAPTTGQQAAVNCDLNNNILVSSGGAPNIATSQSSVTTGNISVASARALRRAITITNVTGTSAIYCGNTGVTTSTGTYLGATAGSSITLNTTAAVFCTVAATTQTVTAAETY